MKNEYGLRKLALINSANYSVAEIPLDDSVSLVGKNNSGKTSLINALQYLLIRDRQQMNFEPHDKSSSDKFYFPKPSSYILLEIQLKSGLVVVGCVGKGISNEYQYFSYEGSLKAEDFRDDDGSIIEESVLDDKLREKGVSINRYRRSTEFFNNLYAKGELGAGEQDIRLFSLLSPQLKDAFQQVLTKTLHLDQLDAKDVKKFLLQYNAANYSKEASTNAFDFKKTWDEAFQTVEYDRDQYKACKKSIVYIDVLKKKYERIKELRGKIGTMRPIINNGLSQWEEYKNKELARLDEDYERTQGDKVILDGDRRNNILENSRIKQEREQLKLLETEYDSLQNHFQLAFDRKVLEENFESLSDQVADFRTRLNNAKQGNLSYIKSQINQREESISQLQRELNSGEKLFKRKIQLLLTSEEMDVLYGLLNKNIFSLDAESMTDVAGFAKTFKEFLANQGDVLNINGLTVDRKSIAIHYEEQSSQELAQTINMLNNELTELRKQADVLIDTEKARYNFAQLNKKMSEAQNELKRYDRFEELRNSVAERNVQKAKLDEDSERNKEEEEKIKTRETELNERYSTIDKKRSVIEDDNDKINSLRENRLDMNNYLDVLEQEHYSYSYDDDVMQHLKDALQEQIDDCKELNNCSSSVKTILLTIQGQGFTKFAGVEIQDEMIERIIEFSDCLSQEEEHIQKNLVVAITRVANVLRELENQYNYFCRDLQDFNRLISKRPVSDLKKLKVEPNTHDLLDAVRTIAKRSGETNDAMDLFYIDAKEGSAGNPEIDKAKEVLIRFCNQQGSLKLADLFDLSFVVQKTDEPERPYNDLNKIGSNGTVLMSKLIFGLALLYMMTDKKKSVSSVCYLDEAASIDEFNQKNLIKAASDFGYNILFASPTPLTTVRYCVRIEKQNGKNIISNKQWIRFDDIDEVDNDK